jgi:hypothetical protein
MGTHSLTCFTRADFTHVRPEVYKALQPALAVQGTVTYHRQEGPLKEALRPFFGGVAATNHASVDSGVVVAYMVA